MNATFSKIESLILRHIDDIDRKIDYLGNFNVKPDLYGSLFKSKSLALQSLVDLKIGEENSHR